MSLKIDRVQLEIVIQQDQARQKMIELEERMRSANRELQKTKKQFGETSEEYKKQTEVIKQLQQEYDNLYEEIGLTNLSLRDLGKRQKDLNAILRQLNPNTELYKQYSEQLKEVNNRIKELRGTANETRFSLSKLTDGFNKYGAIAASAIAGLTGITLTMRSCVNEYAEMEEAQSQVIKYTGLTKDEVKELNEEFKQMDTRTARTRLNELAGDAGKLGISTKEGVKEFVEAADMINVALGEDLGKEAITQIGKLADMFGTGDRSLKENMLAVGSAVNSVAQNSSAAEPYLVEFTARMGGVGKQANMAITDIMGFASALDQNMLRSEMASTALSGLILKLYQEPSKYAQLAGLQVEEFTKLMSEDVNEAVLTFLEALNRMGGMDKMAPVLDKMSLSGAEAASVISALAGNVEKVRKEQLGANQAFVEGTSVVNEFNVQNSTVQAELDKAKKRFADIRVELGEQLLPVMKYMVSTGSLTVKGLSAVVSVLMENKRVIVTVTSAIAAYVLVVNGATLAKKAYTVATKAATMATNLFSKATKASPWGLVISGVTAAITYFSMFRDETDKNTESQKKLNDALQQNADDMNSLRSVQDRAKNMDTLNKRQLSQLREDAQSEVQIIEDKLSAETIAYRKYYDEQKKIIESRTDINQAQKAALIRALDNDTDEKAAELAKLLDQKNQLIAIINKIPKGKDIFTEPILNDTDDKVGKAKKEYEQQLKDLRSQHALGLVEEEDYQKKLYDLEIKYLSKKRELYAEAKMDASLIDQQILSAMTFEAKRLYANKLANQQPVKPQERQMEIIEEEDPVEDTYALDKYKQSLDGQLALLEAFHDAGIISEMEYQDRLSEINKQKEEERAQVRKAALDTFNQLAGSMSQLMNAMQDSEISKIEKRYDAQIKVAQKEGKDTTELEEQKEEAILAVKRKYADKQFALQVLQVTASTAVSAMEAYKAMAGIPVVGPALGAAAAAAAVIAGMAQIAVAKQQADEAKGLYTGGYSDDFVQGYTAKGDSHDVAGVIPVHKNEFVTNHEGVANPHVKQFLDVFDIAQKNGTIGMLNTTQILQQVRVRSGRYSGGYTDDTTNPIPVDNGGFSSSEILAWIKIIAKELQKSNIHLSAIAAKDLTVNVRSVRDGIKRLEMLEKNASR
ncbi:phage tail tape measure protein [Phocaeicola plebeius]|uniref:phage tail tape measure protein n=1 Tax=Phocaeicola plebeius TaxID=310297 RepID=UPI0020137883|nr:phage tail tape measure protein [Phocaeicola plebeius]MCL1613125.1 phage tail tape measure protein [Phocaeicola plebeius]